jgi:hypothetical protein
MTCDGAPTTTGGLGLTADAGGNMKLRRPGRLYQATASGAVTAKPGTCGAKPTPGLH